MIELLQEYWKPFLYSDGNNINGLAMTLWLLSASNFVLRRLERRYAAGAREAVR